jgi:hypothetical protein
MPSRLSSFLAKPLQSQQTNQSNCEVDGYISIRALIPQTPTDGVREPPQSSRLWGDRLATEEPSVAKRPALTTTRGMPVPDNQNSITAGPRDPVLMTEAFLRFSTVAGELGEAERDVRGLALRNWDLARNNTPVFFDPLKCPTSSAPQKCDPRISPTPRDNGQRVRQVNTEQRTFP